MKIRTRILINFLVVFVIIVTIVTLVTVELNTRAIRATYLNNIQGVSEMRDDEIRRFIQDQKTIIIIISQEDGFQEFLQSGQIRSEYATSAQQLLGAYLKEDSIFNEIFLLDNKGKVVLSTDKTQVGEDKNNDPYFVNGLKGPYIKDIYLSSTTNKIGYALSAPIIDSKTGKTLGVVVARVKPDGLFNLLEDRSGLGQTGETFLINKDRMFLTPSLFKGSDVILKEKVETQNAKDCFNPEEIAKYKDAPIGNHLNMPQLKQYVDYRGVNIYGTHSYIQESGWCLIAKIDQSEVSDPVRQQIIFHVAANIIGGLIFIIVAFLVSRSITKPLEELHEGTEVIEKGNLDYKVGTDTRDEVGQLSRSFDVMVASIKQSRIEVDKRVEEQTKELVERSRAMEEQRAAILNILEDVEDEKNKTAVERDRMDAILHSIGDGVFVVDKNLSIILINDVALKMCGHEIKDAVGKNYNEVLRFVYEAKPDTINDKFIKDAMATGKVQEMANHTMLECSEGRKIAVADSAAPLKDKNGVVVGCVVVFRDVSKERQIDRMKTEFISLASHQLRTPLSAIKWFVELLGDTKLDAEQKDFSKNIAMSTERMIELVNALLNVSRIESGRIVIAPTPTNIGDLLKGMIKELQQKIDERKQVLNTDIAENLSKINIDPALIRQVYMNLLTNAIKYTPVKGKISVKIFVKDTDVISQITDTGIGIPEEDKNKVFTKFYRSADAVKIEPNGNGLGLYLAIAIVESSGGKMWFESKVGQGTSFFFSLPLSGSKPKKGEVSLDS
ncbi:MAG: ATP-binding protein [Microgenomates group bacterium]|jgi:PAS domain S-box-containing protein